MPASRMASVQGGWRPWWQQGSSVTYIVAPAGDSVQCARALRSACASPQRSWKPSPMTRPSFTTTAPTMGFGEVQPTPRPASSRALRIYSVSVIFRLRKNKNALNKLFRASFRRRFACKGRPAEGTKKLRNGIHSRANQLHSFRCVKRFSFIQTVLSASESHRIIPCGSWAIPPVENFTPP